MAVRGKALDAAPPTLRIFDSHALQMGERNRRDVPAETARDKRRRQHDVAAVRDDQGRCAVSQTPRDRLPGRELLARKAQSMLATGDELEDVLQGAQGVVLLLGESFVW